MSADSPGSDSTRFHLRADTPTAGSGSHPADSSAEPPPDSEPAPFDPLPEPKSDEGRNDAEAPNAGDVPSRQAPRKSLGGAEKRQPPAQDSSPAREPPGRGEADASRPARATRDHNADQTSDDAFTPQDRRASSSRDWLFWAQKLLRWSSVVFVVGVLVLVVLFASRIRTLLAQPATVLAIEARTETLDYVVDDPNAATMLLPRALTREGEKYVCRTHVAVAPAHDANVAYTMVEGSELRISVFPSAASNAGKLSFVQSGTFRSRSPRAIFIVVNGPDRPCGIGHSIRLPIAGAMTVGTPKEGADAALSILAGHLSVYGRAARLNLPLIGGDADKLYLADDIVLPPGSLIVSPGGATEATGEPCPGPRPTSTPSWRGFVDARPGDASQGLNLSATTNASTVMLAAPITTQARPDCPDVISLTKSAHFKNDPNLHALLAAESILIVGLSVSLQMLSLFFTVCENAVLARPEAVTAGVSSREVR